MSFIARPRFPSTRPQRILYGKTYHSFLFCDQIGRALIARAKKEPSIVVIDRPDLIAMHETLNCPLFVLSDTQAPEGMEDGDESNTELQSATPVGDHHLFGVGPVNDRMKIALAQCVTLAETIPLDEPFERINQAIDEAQSVIR